MGVGIPWKPISEKPEGPMRKVLLWLPSTPKIEGRPQFAWWVPSKEHFSWNGNLVEEIITNASHWAEITEPGKPGEPSLEKVYQETIESLSCKLAMHIDKTKQMQENEVHLLFRIFELQQKIVKLEKKNDQPA